MEKFSKLLKESNHTVVFTGAGMSTESGLPDFRSKTGLWKQKDPTKLASTMALTHHREEFYTFYKTRIESLQQVEPHAGHKELARWEKKGLVQHIITQNVDGLHQKAGSKHVTELHGTLTSLRCHECGKMESIDMYINKKTACPSCGGFLRPNVVLFGEMLPEDAVITAEEQTNRAELFVVLGSSLTVTPASTFPQVAKENGATLVIINHDETPLDPIADLVIHDKKIGDALTETARYL